jgi:hypothetical protein
VTDKGFISFAGQEIRERADSRSAKLMKPCSELNWESTWLFNGFCSVEGFVGEYGNGVFGVWIGDMREGQERSGHRNVDRDQRKWANPGAPEWCKMGGNTPGVCPAEKVEPGSWQSFRRRAS